MQITMINKYQHSKVLDLLLVTQHHQLLYTIEMDLLWQATENLRVAVSAAWLDPKYDEFTTGACTEIQYAYFRAIAGPANGYDAKYIVFCCLWTKSNNT